MKIGMISLGCPKNLADTEVMLGKLVRAGHTIVTDELMADALIINTCAFIKPAIDEAMAEIRRAVKLKEKGTVKYVVVAGCLPKRLGKSLKVKGEMEKFNGVDLIIGPGDIDKLVKGLKALSNPSHLSPLTSHLSSRGSCLFNWKTPRIKATPRHYSYIKIADGCDNRCSYCTIPAIRGVYKSRPIPDIVKEAGLLARSGTKELILIAQDTTYYGKDLYGKFMLAALLKRLCKVRGIKWIRIMYTHPAHVTDELIKVMAGEHKVCKYIDLPIQHSCDNMLSLMRRRVSRRKIIDLIAKIRKVIPGVAVRTSLIVGFPGEKEKDFLELTEFIKKEKFERIGIFTYSRESGTAANKMRGHVPERVKMSRYHRAMRLAQRISREKGRGGVGKVISVMIDNISNNLIRGRRAADAPEIDGSVHITLPRGRANYFKRGDIIKAKVIGYSAYDLLAQLVT